MRLSLIPSCVSRCHLHHPHAAGQSEQLRQPLHLPAVQREAAQEIGGHGVRGPVGVEGLHPGGGHHGQLPVHQPQEPVRQQIKKPEVLAMRPSHLSQAS